MKKIIFVADYYMDEFLGGAELSTEALIKECPYEFLKFKSSEVTADLIEEHRDEYWIFGNFTFVSEGSLKKITDECRYSVLDHDFKLCDHRCPEVHKFKTGNECNCCNPVIIGFYTNAEYVFFMSKRQMDWSIKQLPFMNAVLLTTPFARDTLQIFRDMREQIKDQKRNGKWIILFSDSWVKGSKEAVRYALANDLDYEIIYKKPYIEVLIALSQAEGYIYMPAGSDICPRAVTEAKLLGCKLLINDYVLQREESWFDTDDGDAIITFLESRLGFFWGKINEQIEDAMGNKTA